MLLSAKPIAANSLTEAVNSGVLTNKLLQFANGSMYLDDQSAKHIHDAKLDALELKDMDQFFYGPYRQDTKLGKLLSAGTENDRETAFRILDAFVERSARLAAANIACAIIKSGKGTNPARPVSVLCEGTTFLRTHNLRERVTGFLNRALIEERGIWYEIVTMENAVTLGSAVAGLI